MIFSCLQTFKSYSSRELLKYTIMSNHTELHRQVNGKNELIKTYFDLEKMDHIVKPPDRRRKFYPGVLDAIGNTPLVRLNKIPKEEGLECEIYAKCEYMNPGGSVKDRIAYRMVVDAEKQNILTPGKSVIVEPSSGNTGIGLALAAAIKGYRCIIVLLDKMSDEKVNTLKLLGAEVIRTPTDAPAESPLNKSNVALRLSKEIPNAVMLNQYGNPNNPLAHYDGTAEEILWSLDDQVDMMVIGTGTGGTISGLAHKIKQRCPDCVVVGVDPCGSVLALPDEVNKTDVTFYEVEGVGKNYVPQSLDRPYVEKWIKSSDKDAFTMARRLVKTEGLLCGGSSGGVMWAAVHAAKSLKPGQKCVVVLPDGIRNYMTKFVSDQWMEARGFLPLFSNHHLWWWLKDMPKDMIQTLATIPQKSSTKDALAALRKEGAPLIGVVDDIGSLVGIISADNARRQLATLPDCATDDLDKLLQKRFYKVDLAQPPALGLVSRMLDIAPFVVAVRSERVFPPIAKPAGFVTSEDLLLYITGDNKIQNGK